MLERKKDAEIALTFDDGPDPVYTPVLLDLLKRERIKATFFLVGERAARYPELVLRMSREGHCIGLHNYKHQCNWLISPWKNARTLEQSARIIENITGERPVFYRPPWGMMHLLDFFCTSSSAWCTGRKCSAIGREKAVRKRFQTA